MTSDSIAKKSPETHFKRINTVKCLKSGTSTTRCWKSYFTNDKDTIKVFSGGRHTEITKKTKTALLHIIKVILTITAIL
jgi:dissimilatory sulfite reductase (desulfoviridin) alpha/beta subunit